MVDTGGQIAHLGIVRVNQGVNAEQPVVATGTLILASVQMLVAIVTLNLIPDGQFEVHINQGEQVM
jgi:hypothetical protein